jgi:hypothetical protein
MATTTPVRINLVAKHRHRRVMSAFRFGGCWEPHTHKAWNGRRTSSTVKWNGRSYEHSRPAGVVRLPVHSFLMLRNQSSHHVSERASKFEGGPSLRRRVMQAVDG